MDDVFTSGTDVEVGDKPFGASIATSWPTLEQQNYGYDARLSIPKRTFTFFEGFNAVPLSAPTETVVYYIPYAGTSDGDEGHFLIGPTMPGLANIDFRGDRFRWLVDQIDSFAKLRRNWDGEDGVAPCDGAVSAAKRFLAILPEKGLPDESHAIGDGEIVLQWRKEGNFIEVAFDGSTVSWYARIGENSPIYSDDEFSDASSVDNRVIDAINNLT